MTRQNICVHLCNLWGEKTLPKVKLVRPRMHVMLNSKKDEVSEVFFHNPNRSLGHFVALS